MGLENSELFEGRKNHSGELIFKIMFNNVFLASRVKILLGDQSRFVNNYELKLLCVYVYFLMGVTSFS